MARAADSAIGPGDRGGDAAAPKIAGRAARTLVLGPVHVVAGFVSALGEYLLFLGSAVRWGVRPPYRARTFLDALDFFGVGSLPIVLLVGLFSGAVTGLQSVNALRMVRFEAYAGAAVGLSLTRELAPTLTALMVCGRAGAGIATELGTMRITEQIDALETLAVSSMQYLVTPVLFAGLLMVPVLTVIFDTVGMFGGYGVAVGVMHVDPGRFMEYFRWIVDPIDIMMGVIKAAVFGVAVALIGCYQGYHAGGGAKGVGLATTRAVVIGSVTVLLLDYFLTDLLFMIFPAGGH